MKKRILHISFLFLAILFGANLYASPVVAQTADTPSVLIYLTIETPAGNLFDNDVTVSPCPTPNNETPTLNGFCIFSDAGLSVDASWFSFGTLINSINEISDPDNYWLWFLNGDIAQTGIDSYILQDGDTILWTLGVQPLKITVSTTTPTIGDTVTLTVMGFDPNAFDFVPVAGAVLDELATTTSEDGTATIVPSSNEPINFTVSANGFIKSKTITINPVAPVLPSENIILKIFSGDTVLFNAPMVVTACPESPELDAPITIGAKCAIEQSGLSNTWSWYDSDFKAESDLPKTLGVLTELGGSSSDDINYIYWGWFSNLNYGTIALNKHTLSADEELLLTYNSYPLRISTPKNSATVGDTIIFTAEGENTFDENFNLTWAPLQDVEIVLGAQSCFTTIDGTCSIVLDTVGSFKVSGSKSLYVPTNDLDIEVLAKVVTSSGGDGGTKITPTLSTEKALDYLKSMQKQNGSFNDSTLYSDWVAIAFGAMNVTGNAYNSLLDYLKSNNTISSLITDNERRAMALLALGKNPYSFNDINYIDSIVDAFDQTQFGDKNLVNDDIFALIPLMSAGYTKDDDIIIKDVAFIISKQKSNGSWEESIDITAAAIQALKPIESITGVSESISRAIDYLISKQNNNGGWNNSVFSTSWVMQAESILGSVWTKNNKNGLDYLGDQQATDGAVSPQTETLDNRIWATSYAILAGLSKPWNQVMQSVPKVTKQTSSTNSLGYTETSSLKNTVDDPEIFTNTPPEDNNNSTQINTPLVNQSNSLKPKKQISEKLPTITLAEETKETPEDLTATVVNAVSSNNNEKKIPIILGIISGIILLYIAIKKGIFLTQIKKP